MPDPTLADIAATIRKHAPEALPKSLHILGPDDQPTRMFIELADKAWIRLPDDFAAAVLRDAMVMDCEAHRCGWSWFVENSRLEAKTFDDSYHGNSSLLSCYAAWKWARGAE